MPSAQLAALAVAGVVAGLVLLGRGMRAYVEGARIAGTSSSPIASLAAGEVRVSGTVEPADVLLVSPLQSRHCVWYRSGVVESRGRAGSSTLLDEERAVGFRVRDPSGTIRVFPRGGRFDAPDALHAGTGLLGDEPVGLDLRTGPAVDAAELDRATLVARLTTVRDPGSTLDEPAGLDAPTVGRREYREARIEPGDVVTIVGSAVPFSDLPDPDLADAGSGGLDAATALADPEIAADLADARAAGTLAADPTEAWGNAAIPGFGIGRPVRPPELDHDARPLPLAPASEAEASARRWTIEPHELVLAATPDVPLLVATGVPGAVTARRDDRFLLGLAGAVVSIASAVVLAIVVQGGL
ncbi:MAG TPA: hypothetical protein VFI28_02750 [Candidatus Limnocylindrales bacterium]|nr:hypothetical protein [Candidatus Limnocylindrales bacterium]